MLTSGLRRASFAKSFALPVKSFRYFSIKLEIGAADESAVESLSPEEFRLKHQIVITGAKGEDYPPVKTFSSSPFSPEFRKILTQQGYDTPTPIQAQSWPIIMDKKDIISVARTGSGKTIGFLMPALQKLLEAKKNPELRQQATTSSGRVRRGPSCLPTVLVLAPTRELGVQIEGEAAKYCINGIRSVCLYGGASKGPQINELRNGVDIVVATPGRCNDLNIMGALDLSAIKYLVLDEADRMLDMGFEPQIREIVDQLPLNRQTVFFTATWPKEVQELARSFLIDPVQINVGDNATLNANKKITQNIIVTNPRDKLDELFKILENINEGGTVGTVPKTLVFCATKADCDFIAEKLEDERYVAEALHGDKTQVQRDRAMDRFRANKSKILVATDVAARGLDVKDIQHVINYDFPTNVEDYVHRIGRTARGENSGVAHSLLTQKELSNRGMMKELVGIMKRCDQEIPEALQRAGHQDDRDSNRSSRGAMMARGSNRYGAPTASSRGSGNRGFSFSGFGERSGISGGGRFGAFASDRENDSSAFGRGSMSSRLSGGGAGGSGGFNRDEYAPTFNRSNSSGGMGGRGGQRGGAAGVRKSDFDQDDEEYNRRQTDGLDEDDYKPRYKKAGSKKRYDDDDDEDGYGSRRRSTRRDKDYDDY